MSGETKVFVNSRRHDLVVITAEIHRGMPDGYADPYPAFEVRMPLPTFVDPAELGHALAEAVTRSTRRSWWGRFTRAWAKGK